MPIIRTTMRPHEELEVDDREYQDLAAQNLIAHTAPPTSPVRRASTVREG